VLCAALHPRAACELRPTFEALFGARIDGGFAVSEVALPSRRRRSISRAAHLNPCAGPSSEVTARAVHWRYGRITGALPTAALSATHSSARCRFVISSLFRLFGPALGQRQFLASHRVAQYQLGWTNRGATDGPRLQPASNASSSKAHARWQPPGRDLDQPCSPRWSHHLPRDTPDLQHLRVI